MGHGARGCALGLHGRRAPCLEPHMWTWEAAWRPECTAGTGGVLSLWNWARVGRWWRVWVSVPYQVWHSWWCFPQLVFAAHSGSHSKELRMTSTSWLRCQKYVVSPRPACWHTQSRYLQVPESSRGQVDRGARGTLEVGSVSSSAWFWGNATSFWVIEGTEDLPIPEQGCVASGTR